MSQKIKKRDPAFLKNLTPDRRICTFMGGSRTQHTREQIFTVFSFNTLVINANFLGIENKKDPAHALSQKVRNYPAL